MLWSHMAGTVGKAHDPTQTQALMARHLACWHEVPHISCNPSSTSGICYCDDGECCLGVTDETFVAPANKKSQLIVGVLDQASSVHSSKHAT